ncbi:hypothetical protein D9M71_105810 [compost metagenome]
MLGLGRLLQGTTQLFQTLDLLLFAGVQLFQEQLAAGQLLAQFEDGRILRIGRQQLQLFTKAALALGQALHALVQLLDARLLHFGLAPGFG